MAHIDIDARTVLRAVQKPIEHGTLRLDAPLGAIPEMLVALGASQQIRFVTDSRSCNRPPMALVRHCLEPWAV